MDFTSMSKTELEFSIQTFQDQLKTEEDKIKLLEHQIHHERAALIEKVKDMEAEEEFITIKLLKRLEEIKSEKAHLMNQVEQEEEYLTNNLQKRLEKVQQEKIELENKLELEEEMIVNHLQKQLEELLSEKSVLQQLGEESSATIENRKLRSELESFKQATNHKIQHLTAQNSKLQEDLIEWQSKCEDLSTTKFELERESEDETLPEDENPPVESRPVSAYRNCIQKGWFNVKQNDDEESPQYLVLTPKEIVGFEREKDRIPEGATLTTIQLEKVSNVVVKDGGISIQDKGGNYYHIQGTDTNLWSKLISSLLPNPYSL
jgi:chromosome segregation ATPase